MKKQRASVSGLESEFRKSETGSAVGVGLGMGFAGVGADDGFGNGFGGPLRRASEALTSMRSGGVAESASMPVSGVTDGGPAGESVAESSAQGARAPSEEVAVVKNEAMEEEEL